MGRFNVAYPDPPSVVDASHDNARNLTATIASIAALLAAGVSASHPSTTERSNSLRKNRVCFILRIAVWILAAREMVLAALLIWTPTPLLVPADSTTAVLIFGVMTWLVAPGLDAKLLLPLLTFGLGLNIAAWVMDIRRTETIATYLNAKSYLYATDQGFSINNEFVLGPSEYEYYVRMSLAYQMSTIYWVTAGITAAAASLPIRRIAHKE